MKSEPGEPNSEMPKAIKELESLCDPQKDENEMSIVVDVYKKPRPRFYSFYGLFFGILSALFLSVSNVLIKKAKLFTGTEQTAVRYSIQMILMLTIAYRQNLNVLGPVKERKLLLLRGIMGTCGLTTLHMAIKFINPSDVVALFHTNVVFIAIFARFVLNEKFSIAHLVSMLMAIAGTYILFYIHYFRSIRIVLSE